MKLEERKKLFANPTGEYRGKPFWSWNGKLEEEELKRQIDVMKESYIREKSCWKGRRC